MLNQSWLKVKIKFIQSLKSYEVFLGTSEFPEVNLHLSLQPRQRCGQHDGLLLKGHSTDFTLKNQSTRHEEDSLTCGN